MIFKATAHCGGDYFYVMEFVDGETLERLILRSGKLEVNLALEVISQVAAGLAAIQKHHLVHRDGQASSFSSLSVGITSASSTSRS